MLVCIIAFSMLCQGSQFYSFSRHPFHVLVRIPSYDAQCQRFRAVKRVHNLCRMLACISGYSMWSQGSEFFFVFFSHPFHMLVCIPSWDTYLLAVWDTESCSELGPQASLCRLRAWMFFLFQASSSTARTHTELWFSLGASNIDIHSTLIFWHIELYDHILTYIQRNTYSHTLFVCCVAESVAC